MPEDISYNFEQVSIISAFQRLWSELAVFMRSYVNTSIDGSPRAEINAQRLLETSSDFRNALFVFYGPVISNRFNDLLISFIAKSTNVIQGFLSNQQELVNSSVRSWYSDADAMADFLASINTHWNQFQWRRLLTQYIQLQIQMMTAMMSKEYLREMQRFDRLLDLTNTIGSYMASGLIAKEWSTNIPQEPL